MNPWWLFLIIPVSAGIGFWIAALLAISSCIDCGDSQRHLMDVVEARGFQDGFSKAMAKMNEVG